MITPEAAGVSSAAVMDFLDDLEAQCLSMHSVLLAKGESLLAECYWAPFHKDFNHRMYSETKSYAGVAIGLLAEEGKVSLDDKIIYHFPEKLDGEPHPYLAEQTVRDMLMMRTAVTSKNWFRNPDPDRVHQYFNLSEFKSPPGKLWSYDSQGSHVLGVLVEKLSGMSLFDYLYEKIFRHLGTFQNANILKTRNGDSWADSGLLCTSRDMLSFARFVMNYGEWHGERLINADYLRVATAPLSTDFGPHFCTGYGYQIWCHADGFLFNGMGSQFSFCLPKQDLILVCTADTQYIPATHALIYHYFKKDILSRMSEEPLPENPAENEALAARIAGLTLRAEAGSATSGIINAINGRKYIAENNPMGITRFSLHFSDGAGEFRYTNAQGDKVLPFGIRKNVFAHFPQFGYSNDRGGTVTTDGFRYRCATSAAFEAGNVLLILVQIIDRYFGNLHIRFTFSDDGGVAVNMVSNAEDFLLEYRGDLVAHPAEKE